MQFIHSISHQWFRTQFGSRNLHEMIPKRNLHCWCKFDMPSRIKRGLFIPPAEVSGLPLVPFWHKMFCFVFVFLNEHGYDFDCLFPYSFVDVEVLAAKRFYILVDRVVVMEVCSFVSALTMVMGCFYVLGIQYHARTPCSLEFIQR